jgi:transcriptional regulator with XRE-family HTH domain
VPFATQKRLVARLVELRKKHNLTQEGFSERSGISYKYYQAVETGVKMDLRLSTLERLANAYGIEVWQLLSPTTPKTKIHTTAPDSKITEPRTPRK